MSRNHEDHAAVVGGGTMGAGIAQVLARAGYGVTVFDQTAEIAEQVASDIVEKLSNEAKALEAGDVALAGEVRGRVWDEPDLSSFGIVIEAVPELPDLKAEILRLASGSMGVHAVLATNTSSLSIDALSAHVEEPSRFVGMHFFNPVPRSQLVEIVRGAATSAYTLNCAHALASRLGLEGIEVRDSPGFATSRLGLALGLEAIRMVAEDVASPADIDRAMMLAYKHPIGPLRLTDLIGLDVRLDIARNLTIELGDRFSPPQLLVDLVEQGRYGRKCGEGFYVWNTRTTTRDERTS